MSRAAGPSQAAPAPPADRAAAVSSSDQIVREIMQGLYQGRYVPGRKLTENELTRRFGVGRGSVREALKRLAAEGVVTVSLHRGASIRALTRQEVHDVLEVIEALATLAARRAGERLSSPSDVKALRAALKTLTAASSDVGSFEFVQLPNRFYRQRSQISGNQKLARLLPTVQAHLIRVQFRAAYGAAPDFRLDDYRRIIQAVLAKDGPAAEQAMRKHVRSTGETVDALPDEAFAF